MSKRPFEHPSARSPRDDLSASLPTIRSQQELVAILLSQMDQADPPVPLTPRGRGQVDALCAQLLAREAITASSFLPCEILNLVDFDRGEGSAGPRCGKPLLEFLTFLMEGLLVREGPMLYELATERPLPAARLIDIAMQISPPAYAMLKERGNEHRRWVRSKREWEWETGLVVRVDLPMLEQTSYEGVSDLSLPYA